MDNTIERSTVAAVVEKPTNARQWVIFSAITLSIITYIDRVCISQAAIPMQKELGLTDIQMGYAFAAFTWAYALFEIPGGWLGDRFGARKVLMRVVIWWSIFTAATGLVWNSVSLYVTRALFGAGEAGCFPNLTKAFMTWLPQRERVRAQGLMWLSARWGGAFTPFLVASILTFVSWRHAFMVFGAIGVFWAFFFYRWFRDNPHEHPSVNKAEKALLPPNETVMASSHESVPWMKFLKSKTVLLLCAQYICLSFGWYFYITWLPKYLKEARGLSPMQGAILAGMPLFFGGLGSMFSGYLSTYLERVTGNIRQVRRWLAAIGFFGASICLVLFIHIEDPILAMFVLGLASFANDLAMPPSWGACMDVGGKYAGTLSGTMNMMGNFGGGVGNVTVGYILYLTSQNWAVSFYVSAIVYFLGVFCWMFIDPVTPLEKDQEKPLPEPAR